MIKPTPEKQKIADKNTKGNENRSKPVPRSRLNHKQQLFVLEYLVDLNATQAAKRAGYSDRTASRTGAENMAKPLIRAAIDSEIEKRKARIGMTAEDVARELALLGMADISDYLMLGDDGSVTMKPIDQLPEGRSRCVRKIRERRVIKTVAGSRDNPDGDMILEQTVEYELWDKVKSLELLAKHLGMLIEKREDVTKREPKDLSDEEIDKLIERGRNRRRVPRPVVTSTGCEDTRQEITTRLQ